MVITIKSLAESYANKQHPGLNDASQLHKRDKYDFIRNGFNISTIATVVTVALAVFVNSPLFLILAFTMYQTRHAFMKETDCTGLADEARFNVPDVNVRRGAIAQYLGLDQEWKPVTRQFLNFRMWMAGPSQPEEVVVNGHGHDGIVMVPNV